jgi:hypothetical protein
MQTLSLEVLTTVTGGNRQEVVAGRALLDCGTRANAALRTERTADKLGGRGPFGRHYDRQADADAAAAGHCFSSVGRAAVEATRPRR